METSETIRHYSDEEIDISYDAHRCIHSAECIRCLPAVFDSDRLYAGFDDPGAVPESGSPAENR